MAIARTVYNEVVKKAEELGWPSTILQQLSNFLEENSGVFTSNDYDDLILIMEEDYDTYVEPIMAELFPGMTYAELTDDEKYEVIAAEAEQDKLDSLDLLVSGFKAVGIYTRIDNDEGGNGLWPYWGYEYYNDTFSLYVLMDSYPVVFNSKKINAVTTDGTEIATIVLKKDGSTLGTFTGLVTS